MFKSKALLTSLVLLAVLGMAIACTPAPSGNVPAGEWTWPGMIMVSSSGQSGMAKDMSWVSLMTKSTGANLRVIPGESTYGREQVVKEGKMFMYAGEKSIEKNRIEGLGEEAQRDGGPFQTRIVWVHSLAHSAYFVRADSKIKSIYDLKPGVRFTVSSMKADAQHPLRALAAWAKLPEKDIVWVNGGSSQGSWQQLIEGRADVIFSFPVSPRVAEAWAAPGGLRVLEVNSAADPEGADRYLEISALYQFGVIKAAAVPEFVGKWGSAGYKMYSARADADPELVYRFAKFFDENYDKYKGNYAGNVDMDMENLKQAVATTFLPVHDGLIRYLKEKGVWNADYDRRQKENVEFLTKYEKGYAAAIAQADKLGIKVSPDNKAWMELWGKYKFENKLPYTTMNPSLTVRGPVIYPPTLEAAIIGEAGGAGEPEEETVTPTLDKVPKPPPPPAGMTLEFTSMPASVVGGEPMTVEVKTVPGAECKIEFIYNSGTVSALVFKDMVQKADADGKVKWTGTTSARGGQGSPGPTVIQVSVTTGGKTGVFQKIFELKAP